MILMMTNYEELTDVNIRTVEKSLIFYRIMAYIVGVLLVVLVVIGMPLKYIFNDGRVVTWTGVPHGWLYAVLLVAAFNLKYRAKWGWGWFIVIALAGTVPFLSFVAEHFATKDVKERLAKAKAKADRKITAPEGASESN